MIYFFKLITFYLCHYFIFIYFKNLDSDLNNRYLVYIEPLLLLGEALISDKHPASDNIKVKLNKIFKINLMSLNLS